MERYLKKTTSNSNPGVNGTNNINTPSKKVNQNNNIKNIKSSAKKSESSNLKEKIVLYILTRDFRTEDNLTLYKAYDEAIESNSSLCLIFRFHPDQIYEERNPYYSSYAVQFMIEALEKFSEEVNFCYLDPIEDDEFSSFLKTLPIHKIFIMRDFSPFARKRFEFYSSIATCEEVDDATVYPIDSLTTYNKLAYFISNVKHLDFNKPIKREEVDWQDSTQSLLAYTNAEFVHKGKINIPYKDNKTILVHPVELESIIEKIPENLKGYSVKKVREQVGSPKVTMLSAFIKFGLISIRSLHEIVRSAKGVNSDDKTAFERELLFRDFFYRLAWTKHNEVFYKPNWQGATPRFISEGELLEFKKNAGQKQVISKEEIKDIQEAKAIYDNFVNGETEYPLINAAVLQLKTSGYMLNRTRMLTASYLTQDNKLWWKYAEKFFANYLTEYDWTINTLNHQNIAKVGVYPKYTQNFSIKRQQSMNTSDKKVYINKYLKK